VTPLRRILVIGASTSGLRAAMTLRREGHDGQLTVLGREEHLPYDRPPLSKQILLGEWDAGRAQIRSADEISDLGIELRLGTEAVGLDVARRRVRLSSGDEEPFDGMIIACGAEPRRPPWWQAGVHELRTIDDAIALRSAFDRRPRVALVGAGFIGGEVASAARARGLDVTVIERESCPYATTLGPEVGRLLADLYRGNGVHLRCGVSVVGLRGAERVEAVELSSGEIVAADVVVVGVGARPATDWLAASAVEVRDGVVCDHFCATSVPNVYACGDVASWPDPIVGGQSRVEHWANAQDQARCAAKNLLRPDGGRAYKTVPYFWSDQFGIKIQSAGSVAGARDCRLVRSHFEDGDLLGFYRSDDRVVGVVGIDCPASVGRARRAIADGFPWSDASESSSALREAV
jgi:NADPH-dependent 2,4-dienoyl-CoA reductase/sulfur reductase-like enzyme